MLKALRIRRWAWAAIVVIVLMVAVLLANTNVLRRDQRTFFGEVWGDLEVEGRIEFHAEQEVLDLYLYHSSLDGGGLFIELDGLEELVVGTQEEEDLSVNETTIRLTDGWVLVNATDGTVSSVLRDARSTIHYSEFRGEAIPGDPFDDPDYTVHRSIDSVSGTGVLEGGVGMELYHASILVNSSWTYIRLGGISVPDDQLANVTFYGSGKIGGAVSKLVNDAEEDYQSPVHIDGRVVINDFRETDRDGDTIRYHERLVLEGGDIEIVTYEDPYTWEHWGFNLEPWTIAIGTDEPGSVSSVNPLRAMVEAFVILGLASAVAIVWRSWGGRRVARVVTANGSGEERPLPIDSPLPAPMGLPFKPEHKRATHRFSAPVMGGIICIVNGIVVLTVGVAQLGHPLDTACLVTCVILPIIGIIGGVSAIMRRDLGMAVLGAVATMGAPGMVVLGPVGIPVPWLGIAALLLIFLGRREFPPTRRSTPPFIA